jgi:hypothetical protein
MLASAMVHLIGNRAHALQQSTDPARSAGDVVLCGACLAAGGCALTLCRSATQAR